jgi:hypothetical protein
MAVIAQVECLLATDPLDSLWRLCIGSVLPINPFLKKLMMD